ncbi:MAG: hypothetical protein LBE18_04560 [Planctomycetaceae bacterium]|jgi:hypothetical protein|nr:hypothetical protein [Planctomycetaceae bacterium]
MAIGGAISKVFQKEKKTKFLAEEKIEANTVVTHGEKITVDNIEWAMCDAEDETTDNKGGVKNMPRTEFLAVRNNKFG